MRLPFALLLISMLGCGQAVGLAPVTPSPSEAPMTGGPDSMSSIGFHDAVDWQCHQADVTDNLVWIECKFDNTSATSTNEVCIRIIISDFKNQEVDRSRLVCSGPMLPGTSKENYAAFQNSKHSHQRAILNSRCGFFNSSCKMTTKEFPRE